MPTNLSGQQPIGSILQYLDDFADKELIPIYSNSQIFTQWVESRQTKDVSGGNFRYTWDVYNNYPVSHSHVNKVNGTFPEGGRSNSNRHGIGTVRYHSTDQISRQFLRQAEQSKDKAMIEQLCMSVTKKAESVAMYYSGLYYGDGTGRLAIARSSGTSPAGTLNGTLKLAVSRADGTTVGNRRLEVNGRYQLMTADGATTRVVTGTTDNAFTIISKETDSIDSVVVSQVPVGVANGDILVYKGDYGRVPFGLENMVANNNATIFELSRQKLPELKSVVVDANTNNISISILDRITATIRRIYPNVDLRSQYVFLMSQAQEYKLRQLVNSRKIADSAETVGQLGYERVEYRNMKMIMDAACEDDLIYLLKEDDFFKLAPIPLRIYEPAGFVTQGGWINEFGGGSSSDTINLIDAVARFWEKEGNFGCSQVGRQGLIRNLDTTGAPDGRRFISI